MARCGPVFMLDGRIAMPDGRIFLRDGCVVTLGGSLGVAADDTVAASNAGTSTCERRDYAERHRHPHDLPDPPARSMARRRSQRLAARRESARSTRRGTGLDRIFVLGAADMGEGSKRPSPTTITASLSHSDLRALTWPHDYTFLITAPPSPPSSANGLIGILDSGATRTIVTGAAIRLFRGPLQEVEAEVSTAAHGGNLRVTHEGMLGDGLQAYYATELRQSV